MTSDRVDAMINFRASGASETGKASRTMTRRLPLVFCLRISFRNPWPYNYSVCWYLVGGTDRVIPWRGIPVVWTTGGTCTTMLSTSTPTHGMLWVGSTGLQRSLIKGTGSRCVPYVWAHAQEGGASIIVRDDGEIASNSLAAALSLLPLTAARWQAK